MILLCRGSFYRISDKVQPRACTVDIAYKNIKNRKRIFLVAECYNESRKKLFENQSLSVEVIDI